LTRLGLRLPGHSAELERNSLFLVLNTCAGAGFGFLFWLTAARRFEPTTFGSAAALLTLLPLVSTLALAGLPETIWRFLSPSPDPRAFLLRSLKVSLPLSFVTGFLWWGFIMVFDSSSVSQDRKLLAVVLSLLVGSVSLSSLVSAALIAVRRPAFLLAETVSSGLVRLGLLALLPVSSPLTLLVVFLLASSASSAVSLFVVLRLIPSRPGGFGSRFRFGPDVRRFAQGNWLTGSVSLAPRALVVSIVSWRLGSVSAAWVAVPLMVYPFLVLVSSASFRSLLASASASPVEFPRLARQMLQSSLLFTSLAAAVVSLAASPLLSLFGESYVAADGVLRLFALAAILATPNYVLDATLLIRKDVRGFTVSNLLGSAWIVGSVLIGSEFGLLGVGFGWVVGQVGYGLVSLWVVFRSRVNPFVLDVDALRSTLRFFRLKEAVRQVLPAHPLPASFAGGFVVILTYGRTGSTVIQALLNAHDGVCVRGENMNLPVSLFRAVRSARQTASHAPPSPSPSNDPWFGAGNVSPGGMVETLRHLVVKDLLALPADARWGGFKEIRHTPAHFQDFAEFAAYVKFLDELLPGVRFVLNVRSIEQTASSGWWVNDPDGVDKIRVAREWIESLPGSPLHGLSRDRFLSLNYDTWADSPEALLPLLRFLSLPEDLSVVSSVLKTRLAHMKPNP